MKDQKKVVKNPQIKFTSLPFKSSELVNIKKLFWLSVQWINKCFVDCVRSDNQAVPPVFLLSVTVISIQLCTFHFSSSVLWKSLCLSHSLPHLHTLALRERPQIWRGQQQLLMSSSLEHPDSNPGTHQRGPHSGQDKESSKTASRHFFDSLLCCFWVCPMESIKWTKLLRQWKKYGKKTMCIRRWEYSREDEG